ncbi:hypothetical protein GCM10009733_052220 [Nonomuraea maheshkhaliensis]|uniref:Septum formation initiator family protein n=1 Tax=Nonomuraea maheshkhaliensis TaxID=419590 RepID=A0ABN2FIJ2_9ACTN
MCSNLAKRPQLTGRAAILAVVVCAIAMSLAYPVREYISLRRSISELRAEKARVEAEKQALLARDRQSDDPNWIKKTAKERLHYCGPGEKCYVVMEPDQSRQQAAVKQPAVVPPWYETLWESVEAADKGTGRRAVTAAEPSQGPSQGPGRGSDETPAKQPSKQPAKQPTKQPTEQPTGQPTGPAIGQPTKQPAG